MDILNKPPQNQFSSEEEKERFAKAIIDIMIRLKLMPKYDWFDFHEKAGLIPSAELERSKIIQAQDLAAKIMIEETLMESHPARSSYMTKLSGKGRRLYDFECLDMALEEFRKESKMNFTHNQQNVETNYGLIAQESVLSESPTTQSVNTTPNKNESNIKIPWYKRTIFKSFIFPILVGVIVGLLILYWRTISKNI